MTNTRQTAIDAVRGFKAGLQTRLDSWPAYTGDGRGNLRNSDSDTQFMLVRWPLATSPAVEVLNESLPDVENLRVMVGYTADQPDVLRILSRADSRADNTTFVGVMNHSQQHGYLAADMDWIDFRRVLTFRVIPYDGLNVYVYGGVLPVGGTFMYVNSQVIDMTASVPVSGARYAALSIATDGTVTVTNGSTQPTAAALTVANVPAVPSGEFRLAAVLLRSGQTSITETLAQNDLLDLRWPQAHLESSLSPSSIALADTHLIVGNASGVGSDAGTGLTYAVTPRTLSVDNLQFDLTPTPIAPVEGLMYWNVDDGTLNLGMPGGSVNLQIGQEMLLRAKNTTGADITNGQLVYISSGTGSNAIISLAKADAEATSATTIGMATELIANNHFGYVTLIGMVRDVNTIAYTAGTALYLSAATAGAYTSTKPDAPNHLVTIGVVIRQHATEGVIFVRIDNGYELSELHDVYISGIANGDILRYVSANNRWENKTLASAGLVSGTGAANQIAYFSGTSTITSGANLTWSGSGNMLLTGDLASVTTGTATSGTVQSGNFIYNYTPSGSSSAITRGGFFRVITAGANNPGTLNGLACQVNVGTTTATMTGIMSGGQFIVSKTGASGTINSAFGGEFYVQSGSTSGGAIGSARGGSFGYTGGAGTVAVTNAYAAYIIAGSAGGGTITNLHGLYIEALVAGGTLNRAITTNGGQLSFLHNADSTLATFTGHSTFTAGTTLVQMTRNDANTNAVGTVLTLAHNSTGTAAASFGLRTNYALESATTSDQVAAYTDVLWTDATHASRTALLRGTTTGNATQSGFYGAWSHNAVSSTAITIIPNGTGDVASVGSFVFTVKDNTSATTNGGVVVLNPGGGAVSLLSDGTDTLQITCAADGSVTIARSAGSHTFAVSIWGTWQ